MHDRWWSCDGGGTTPFATSETPPDAAPVVSPSPPRPTRRQLLYSGLMGSLAWAAGGKSALSKLVARPETHEGSDNVLVVIFLRGGADGLNLLAPYGEDAYHRARPTLALSVPKDRKKESAARSTDLDGFFGLHPSLAPLHPLYKEGTMACIHAVGSGDQSRSHFEAMTAMERGQKAPGPGPSSGWIARHLSVTPAHSASPLRAVAFSNVLPDSLRGATDTTVLQSLTDYRLQVPAGLGRKVSPLPHALKELYGGGDDAVTLAGRETLSVLDALHRMDPANYRPSHGAAYPETALGNGLRQVACLVKGKVGLEIACLDKGGWDTHVAQGVSGGGWLALQLDDVGKSVAAFLKDLGPEMRRTTVLLMTEFGRRVRENSGLGTDHGRGSVMFLLGGGVKGGKVYADWPGLEPDRLEPPGDLRVTTDYRNVLAELLANRLGNDQLAAVFPDFTPHMPGIVG